VDYSDISNRVIEIVKEIAEVDYIDYDDALVGDGKLIDSMTIALLVNTIENEFHIGFEDNLDMDYLDSVRSLIDEVYKKVKEQ
jgi:acyl carrier protein